MDAKTAAAIPILATLSSRERDQVLKAARERRFGPGDVVVAEGHPALHVYFVVDGHADVDQAATGRVGRLGPGDFFGELGILEEHVRTATVTASDELTVLMLPAWEFRALLEEHPRMAIPMLNEMIARLHRKEHRGI